MVIDEERRLELNWPDDAGRDYQTQCLKPIETCADELHQIMTRFDNALPRAPHRW
jgi:hypothetical protein